MDRCTRLGKEKHPPCSLSSVLTFRVGLKSLNAAIFKYHLWDISAGRSVQAPRPFPTSISRTTCARIPCLEFSLGPGGSIDHNVRRLGFRTPYKRVRLTGRLHPQWETAKLPPPLPRGLSSGADVGSRVGGAAGASVGTTGAPVTTIGAPVITASVGAVVGAVVGARVAASVGASVGAPARYHIGTAVRIIRSASQNSACMLSKQAGSAKTYGTTIYRPPWWSAMKSLGKPALSRSSVF